MTIGKRKRGWLNEIGVVRGLMDVKFDRVVGFWITRLNRNEMIAVFSFVVVWYGFQVCDRAGDGLDGGEGWKICLLGYVRVQRFNKWVWNTWTVIRCYYHRCNKVVSVCSGFRQTVFRSVTFSLVCDTIICQFSRCIRCIGFNTAELEFKRLERIELFLSFNWNLSVRFMEI